MAQFKYLVFTSPLEGREDEYNDWYTNIHLPDLLNVPGIYAAQRFRLSRHQRSDNPCPGEYLAIYEIESDDVTATFAELKKRAGSPAMVLSPAMSPDVTHFVFEPCTQRLTREGDAG